MRHQRLLVLTYHWPPFPGAGAARWTALVKYLRRLGYETTVITTSAFGALPSDAAEGVVRTRDLAAAGSLRKVLRRPPLAGEGGAESGAEKPAPGILTKVVVPDAYAASWVPFATLAARRLLRERTFDCLITSSPPDSVHLAGLALGDRSPAWIADLRDGWTFERLRPPFPTGAQRDLDARLERRVARGAGAVVCATEPISADLRRRLGVDATTIPNAWDPDLEPQVAAADPPPLDPDRVNLVYTGSLGGVRGHDDSGLFEALRAIVRDDPELATRLRLTIAGPLTRAEQAALRAADLDPVVTTLGPLPREQALALQRRAAALLLVTSHDVSIATGKLFEYLAAERPILALAGANEAARIVTETRTGVVVPPDDAAGIRSALTAIASGAIERDFAPHGLERYRYPAPADAYGKLIEHVVSERPCAG